MANREQFRQPSFFRLNRYLNRIAPISRRLPFAVALARDAVAQGVSLQATLRGTRLFLVVAPPAWARGIVGAFYFHRIPLQNGITYQYAIWVLWHGLRASKLPTLQPGQAETHSGLRNDRGALSIDNPLTADPQVDRETPPHHRAPRAEAERQQSWRRPPPVHGPG